MKSKEEIESLAKFLWNKQFPNKPIPKDYYVWTTWVQEADQILDYKEEYDEWKAMRNEVKRIKVWVEESQKELVIKRSTRSKYLRDPSYALIKVEE